MCGEGGSPEITNLLPVSVHNAEAVLLYDGVPLLLLRLLLLLPSVLPLFSALLEMLVNLREVTLGQVPKHMRLLGSKLFFIAAYAVNYSIPNKFSVQCAYIELHASLKSYSEPTLLIVQLSQRSTIIAIQI